MQSFAVRLLGILLLAAFVLAGGFLSIRFRAANRAVMLQTPELPILPPAIPPDTLRLLSYNISHARGPGHNAPNTAGGTPEEKQARLETIGQQIGQLGLDLVALQNVDFNCWWSGGVDQAHIIARAAGFPYIVRQRNYDAGLPFYRRMDHGNVLLSRFPISQIEKIPFPPHQNWENLLFGNPDALLAHVQISETRVIRVLVTALDNRSEEIRVQATGEIIRVQRAASTPMIVMGTLHSTPPGFPDARTTLGGQNTIEVLESFGGFQRRPARGQATFRDFTHPTEGPRRIIDWILADPHFTFQHYEARRDFTESNHLPVITTLRLRP